MRAPHRPYGAVRAVRAVLALYIAVGQAAAPPKATIDAALARRHARSNATCSLAAVDLDTHGFDVCQMQNVGGEWPLEPDERGRHLLNIGFGETGCEIVLESCHVGSCYTVFDLTASIPVDKHSAGSTPPSIFSSVSVTGATLQWLPEGFAFKSTDSTVKIVYSTHTCAEFYAIRGSSIVQRCSEPLEALTLIQPDIPSLLCE